MKYCYDLAPALTHLRQAADDLHRAGIKSSYPAAGAERRGRNTLQKG
jgi:hypothetical protein